MAEKRYTKNGEWASFDGQFWKVGLAASAASDLGDVTFVEVPEIGRTVRAGDPLCALEAVKAAADYYSPLDGTLAAVNPRLLREPQLVSADPEHEGWLVALSEVSPESLRALLDEKAWKDWEAGR